ncbi:hypothetical protein NMG60_11026187 [Bertholletia excelsa]
MDYGGLFIELFCFMKSRRSGEVICCNPKISSSRDFVRDVREIGRGLISGGPMSRLIFVIRPLPCQVRLHGSKHNGGFPRTTNPGKSSLL